MSRVVMFVLNPCRTDARVLREAATLAAAGHDVTVIARTDEAYAAAGEREARDGFEIVRVPVARGARRWLLLARTPGRFGAAARVWAGEAARRPPAGWLSIAAAAIGGVAATPFLTVLAVAARALRGGGRVVPPLRAAWQEIEWRLQWRFSVLSWAAAASAAAPSADIVHAHDLRALPAARAVRARTGGAAVAPARGAVGGRESTRPALIYDSHEVFVEAGANATRPATARRALRRLERKEARDAAALVTVNDALAALLGSELGLARVAVVRNCSPRWTPPEPRPDLLRSAAGIVRGAPVVLYHGGLAPGRGVEQLAAALREPGLESTHLVVMGMGPSRPLVARIAADPLAGGRVHLLDPVPPDEMLPWVASADVVAVTIQPTTLNHRLSTPNKLFEGLAAGVPVLASDFPPMRAIVLDDPEGPLGAVCDPTDPASIAAGLRELLTLDPVAAAELRARCLRAAHARYAWEAEAEKLLALYRELDAGRVPEGVLPTGPTRTVRRACLVRDG